MNKRTSKLIEAWGLIILAFVTSVILVLFIARHSSTIESSLQTVGIFGPIISILLYGVLSITPIPSDPLTVINGAIFGPIAGSFISWLGNNLAAMIEYFIGEKIGMASNFEKNRKKLPFGLGKFPVNSIWFLIFGRFFPEFGGKIVSVTGGLYKVPIWRYIWTAAVANLFGSIIFAFGGYQLTRFF